MYILYFDKFRKTCYFDSRSMVDLSFQYLLSLQYAWTQWVLTMH